ncbi:MAG: transferase [Nitrosomonadales bacterium]|nr:transferase [Nitrosomonadales bacterium]
MKPHLTERDGILALQFDEWSIQSAMSIDGPDELVIPYTRVMMSFLLLAPSPQHIAMIGLGGGSLAKYCYRHLPDSDITVVEINPAVIALRNEFAIPADDARLRVLLGDGAAWVADASTRPDVLIVDGFDADGLPAQLCSQRFYDDCYTLLADNAVMVANLWHGYPQHDEFLARISNSFSGNMLIVDAEDGYNNIVFAVKSTAFPPSASTIRHRAKSLFLSHPLNFQAQANQLIRALPVCAA